MHHSLNALSLTVDAQARLLALWHVGEAYNLRRTQLQGELLPELVIQCRSSIQALALTRSGSLLAVGYATQ